MPEPCILGLALSSKKGATFYPVQVSAGDIGIQCWGNNGQGQSNVPDGLVNPTEVNASNEYTCAVDVNGVHCWGSNS